MSFEEREEIAVLHGQGVPMAAIGRRLGRSTSTISRELARNRPPWGPYRASTAEEMSRRRGLRPKPGKMAQCAALRAFVEAKLLEKWSPEQISGALREEFPDAPEMHVSYETIYRALFVQGRGELRRELTRCLRTGRALRKPNKVTADQGRNGIRNKIMISERPAEADDRAVPGHWEGDLIVGRHLKSAIGTLVERSTGYVMLLHLPERHDADAVHAAILETIPTLPDHLWRSLTWDQGKEMARHADITTDSGLAVYFCDPHSPWQRGSNENTNGLLRQYFPKSTDLSVHDAARLAHVAAELNSRPRKRFGWQTPAQKLSELLVASTA